ncbi:vitelline membrane outer layer protein 1 homolog [Eleutherodactylus coqui]|uniref:vitelline membrane outer layer protein 1 homolog n=1 Tax=Eleutherodactylus coqui TaxID=57060 RepID=UPI0034624693
MLAVLLILVTLQNLVAAQKSSPSTISVPNGDRRGTWGPMEVCDKGTLVRGFQLKVEPEQGPLDDTALCGIKLVCTYPGSKDVVKYITSSVGEFGDWGPIIWCSSGYFTRFSLKVESAGTDDDTAVNEIKFGDTNNDEIKGEGGPWGKYGPYSNECSAGIVGMRVKLQESRGLFHDDVGVTDVECKCLV